MRTTRLQNRPSDKVNSEKEIVVNGVHVYVTSQIGERQDGGKQGRKVGQGQQQLNTINKYFKSDTKDQDAKSAVVSLQCDIVLVSSLYNNN